MANATHESRIAEATASAPSAARSPSAGFAVGLSSVPNSTGTSIGGDARAAEHVHEQTELVARVAPGALA